MSNSSHTSTVLQRTVFIAILLSFFCSPHILSENAPKDKNKTVTASFRVYDKLTGRNISWARASVTPLNDSISQNDIGVGPVFSGNNILDIHLELPHKRAKYLISVYAEVNPKVESKISYIIPGVTKYDCEPTTFELDLTDLKPNEYERKLPNVYLSRYVERKLGEVTVTASKVKFYYKGDTLVYNADAFITPEGSMLDGLLSQIPDIELKSNGEIYHKGKRVESLLLNGKDLFNKDRQLMLENIGAYTVRDINLYNETGRDSKLLGFNAGDNKYVMNVRLKRQYSQGFLANAEMGYGTKSMYMARLFGMWFSDNVSVSVSGSSDNNTNATRPSYRDGEYQASPTLSTSGRQTTNTGSINYTAEGYASKWKITGDVKYLGMRPVIENSSYVRNYLPTGDTHQYSWSDTHNKSHEVSSNHKAEFSIRNKVNMTVEPTFNYIKNDDRSSSLSAALSEELGDSALSIIEKLYAGGQEGLSSLLNRQRRLSMRNGESINGTLNARGVISTSRRSWLTIMSNASMANRSYDTWQAYNIAYGNVKGSRTTMQHFGATPDRDRKILGAANWRHWIGKQGSLVGVQYTFTNFREKRTRTVHGDTFEGNLITDSVTYDMLPSMTHNLPEISAQSYRSDYDERRHLIWLETTLQKSTSDYNSSLTVELPLRIADRRFTYERGGRTQQIDRTQFMPWLNITASYSNKDRENYKWLSLSFNSTPHYASLFNVVDITDDTDPLNVYVGNPDLKNYRTNTLSLSFKNQKRNSWNNRLDIDYNRTHNANARGYYYNTTTGVRTYRTYNIDGNYWLNATHNISRYFMFDQSKLVPFIHPALNTRIGFVRSVDLVGSTTADNPDFTVAPPKRKVSTLSINETARLIIGITKKASISGSASISYQRYMSPDEGFSDFSSWVNNYSLSGTLNLPRNWSLSTGMTLYTRSGFDDKQLNTSDLVWNAFLSKSILKGQVVLHMNAYDILRQLNNVTHFVNAQARTETVSNVIPSYVLFKIQYRWNKQPKGKSRTQTGIDPNVPIIPIGM